MPKHIGIVAVSPEGSALCYREIFRHAKRLAGDRAMPVVTLHNLPLYDYVDAVRRDDWHTVGDLLVRSSRVLAQAGAEFCIVPDNLMQHAVHLAEPRSPIPWLTMTGLVTDAIAADSRKVVGLIGTKLVMHGSTYQTHLGLQGIHVLIPEQAEVEQVDDLIFTELLFGVTRPESRQRLLEVIEGLGRRGCEGVILGCTEVPLLIGTENSPIPVYDPSDLLAEGAVRNALGLPPGRAAFPKR